MFYTYIITNSSKTVLYTGHTGDLPDRVSQHRKKQFPGFASRYNCQSLLWYEIHETREQAFRRERQIKTWQRQWKRNLISELNPNWHDLYLSLTVDDLTDRKRMHPVTLRNILSTENLGAFVRSHPSVG